jgi:cell division transport system ATP-binding protein
LPGKTKNNVIQFFHVSKEYFRNEALSDINLAIARGEFVFLTGASGAGKSTLLKLIYKEEEPSKGQILIDSVNSTLIPANKLYKLRRQIGIVFQDFKLLMNRTVHENVAIPLLVRGEKQADVEKKVNTALALVGLTYRKRYLTAHISGGEQQRVAIARAIIGNPKILIADEPTGNLDTNLSIEIIKIFERINANGITTIIATHDLNLMSLFPRRIIKLDKGQLVQDKRIEVEP